MRRRVHLSLRELFPSVSHCSRLCFLSSRDTVSLGVCVIESCCYILCCSVGKISMGPSFRNMAVPLRALNRYTAALFFLYASTFNTTDQITAPYSNTDHTTETRSSLLLCLGPPILYNALAVAVPLLLVCLILNMTLQAHSTVNDNTEIEDVGLSLNYVRANFNCSNPIFFQRVLFSTSTTRPTNLSQ